MDKPHENDIRDRAYAFWVEAGSPDGRDDEFWHRAERELSEQAELDSSESASSVTQPTPPAGFPAH